MSNDIQNSENNREENEPHKPEQGPSQAPQPAAEPPANPANVAQTPITRLPDSATKTSEPEDGTMERRTFIKWLAIGWTAFAAIVAGYGTLTLRFLFPNVLFEPKQSFLAGFPDDYEVGAVSERFKSKHAVWIARDAEKLYVLSTVCTHLGCTPNWLENDDKFKCPCHGSGFYKTGINFEGPAPRPLERFRVFLNDNGEIVVDKAKKFQQEKGEWDDPESFLIV